MASLIKKQILKHLSKFTKNLSADKINLSTLRGEGELSNLELDCVALQNVMNLPTWLQINNASCNRVLVKIAWTKLKTVPIIIYLDAVEVEMVTCEKPRAPNGPSPIQASASSGDTSYGFTEKVLEGMTVNINSISVNFSSAAFNATFQLSQLAIFSTNPNWEKTDLRHSRITDKTLGQVLTFKKLSWQTMRIVADAVITNDKTNITPLRLITNQSEITMTFRRRTSDCYVLASRLHVHFDDLLWVLTDSQVQSALLCVKSLSDTIDRSSQQMRDLGLDKAQEANQSPAKTPLTNMADADGQSSSNFFAQHTVIETAYHIDFDRVDLHICEESSPVHQASQKNNMQGGAIQISLHNLKVDHYPYHKAASDRKHFRDDGETMTERNSWSDSIIKQFRRDYVELKKAADANGNFNTASTNKKSMKLVESCLSVRLTDIDIHEVTTSNSKKHANGRLLNSTRKELHLPDEMPLFHFIRTEYYYPDGRDYPAPHNNIFMQVNAPRLNAHWDSLLWLNRLTLTTVQAVQKMLEDLGILKSEDEEQECTVVEGASEDEHVDIRIQVLMPKIFIPGSPSTHDNQPHGLEIQVSRASITNCREGTDCSRTHLKLALNKLDQQYFARNPNSFPSEKDIDLPFMQDMLRNHANGGDLPLRMTLKRGNVILGESALKALAVNDVWSVDLEQVWIDFIMPSPTKITKQEEESSSGGFLGLGKQNIDPITSGLHLPFLDSFPATLWIGKSSGTSDTGPRLASTNSTADNTRNCNMSPNLDNLPLSKMELPYSNHSSSNSPSSHDDVLRSRSHTDVGDMDNHIGTQKTNLKSPSFTNSSPDIRTSKSDSTGGLASPTNELDSDTGRADSPRAIRNRRLLDYYRSSTEDEKSKKDPDTVSQDSRDQISISSTSSGHRQKIISTHILVHTDKPVELQLDHHQYLFLLRLIDTVEDVGKQLDHNSEQIMSSPLSSSFSSPTHSVSNADSLNSGNIIKKRLKPLSTTSIRLAAPSADLYLILRPPPPNVKQDIDKSVVEKVAKELTEIGVVYKDQEKNKSEGGSETGSKKDETPFHKLERNSNSRSLQPPLPRPPFTIQDTPPLSECGSDTLSIQGSDNISIFGDSSTSTGGVYPQLNVEYGVYPHEAMDADEPRLVKRNGSLSIEYESEKEPNVTNQLHKEVNSSLTKQKSGSLSTLTCGSSGPVDSSVTKTKHQLQLRNHSSDNLVVTGSEQASFNSVTAAKSNSSGYESGSYESLPLPSVKNLARSSSPRSSHSHSSSDASDQFVLIQVDEQGRGMEESGIVKMTKKVTTRSPASTVDSSSVRSETSSLSSSQGSAPLGSDSKTTLEVDSMSSCGLADSQITVTNMRSSTSSLESGSSRSIDKNVSRQEKETIEEKKAEVKMSSLVKLHVSDGVELSVDSNDVGDSVVKIVATDVNVIELGSIKTEKVDSIFTVYSPKKQSPRHKTSPTVKKDGVKKLTPQFTLRVDSGPLAARYSRAAAKVGHIQISANSVPLALKSSTLANLGAFVEDEVEPEIVPMKIEAKNVRLTIQDDTPPAYAITPPAPPITLHIHTASVLRTDDGTFHVTTSSSGQIPTALSKSPQTHLIENSLNEAKTEINSRTEPVTSPSSTLREANSLPTDLEKNGRILPSMNTTVTNGNLVNGNSVDLHVENEERYREMKDKLEALEAERDALASALRYMQEELISSERERSNLRLQLP